jgi:hypothetical protein
MPRSIRSSAPRSPLPVLAAALLLGACGGGVFHMRPSTGPLGAPAAGHARVVFVMEEGRTVVTLLDAFGAYLGQLRGGHYLSRDVAPGAYRFYAVRNVSGHVVHTAPLEAGQIYYVLVEDPLLAGFRLRAASCDEAGEALLAGLVRVEPDPGASEAEIRRLIGDEPMRMHEADQRWERLTEAERALRTVERCAAPEPAIDAPATAAPGAGS